DHGGLLMDFLEHEMAKAGFLNRRGVPTERFEGWGHGRAALIPHFEGLARDAPILAVIEVSDLEGLSTESGHVRGKKSFILTKADDERRAVFHDIDGVWLAPDDDTQGIGALQTLDNRTKRGQSRLLTP